MAEVPIEHRPEKRGYPVSQHMERQLVHRRRAAMAPGLLLDFDRAHAEPAHPGR